MKERSSRGQHTLAREYFTSEEIFRLEHERIFSRSWLLAGHVSQLAGPGSYFTFEVGRESVVVLRDRTGEIRAFHNHCRHRGTRLCSEHAGTLGTAIQCPYHAWTYGLDGALRAAPNMQGVAGFDRADYPLHPVALADWQGFLFLNLGADPAPFAEALPALQGKFTHWRLPELRSVHQTVYEVEANWKLFFHNYSECYHCPNVHPHLNKLTPYRNTENDLDEGPVLGGPMWMSNPEGSMTMHGERCAPPFADLSAEERGRVYYYTLFPSAFLSFHPDYVLVHRGQRLAIDRTRIVCDWFFHPDAIAAPGFDPQPAIDFWDLTNRQDWELCANAYKGVVSSAWQPGPYADLESQLAAFDRQYLRALQPETPLALRRA
ncbi:MAG TPA: aromatic ring-hydroxylating dioxygenase subunit alpha [Thermoanaerobaculia bacterium]|jgi:Rieske 2Fe-2S family protein|nr:aromatic ring-hydroxylating dioxygenase subunit alpha [Thermoanaerobaculia bacterium]